MPASFKYPLVQSFLAYLFSHSIINAILKNMRALLKSLILSLVVILLQSLTFSETVSAQTVTVGQGSYTTTHPEGNDLPSANDGSVISPRVSAEFDQTIQTNDYWSNLIFPHLGSDHLATVPAHPLVLQSSENGFEVGYLENSDISSTEYSYSARNFIEVGIAGATSNRTSTHGYGDWTFSAKMEYDNGSLIATTGHGLPYTFFDVTGGNVSISSSSDFTIWHSVDEVIGLSIDGVHYALFAPEGSIWSGTETLTSSLNGIGFLSVAVLPDSNSETLEFFRRHAYAQVTNSVVEWNYDELNSNLTSTYTYETILRDSASGNSSETITALYRHQWINTNDMLTNYTYVSPRGEMKVFAGNSFSTTTRFSGILPALPDVGDYNRLQLLELVQNAANEVQDAGSFSTANTYNSGKQMARFAELVHIADQVGAVSERDFFLSQLKTRLEEWFTLGDDQFFYYDDTWNSLFGYPSSFGSVTEINDHHFHYAYFIKSAATIAQYDSEWALQENWGGMVNLIIRDANNWDREDDMLPFLRNFDSYAGHGWASGHANYNFKRPGFGNNQESSSESINFATAAILWGEITGQDDIRDLGIFLYTTENEAIDQYWFDVDNEVFPESFPRNTVGRVWSDGADYTTWFGNDPEFIHGINFLPINAGSLYLGKHPDYIIENYNALVSQRGGQPSVWKDVFWQYLSMSDAELALSYYNADPNYEPFDGESRAHTMHWLYNMKEMGHYNTDVTANIPTYAVFVTTVGDTTYTAYNAESMPRLISFSDGFSMEVPANTMMTHQTGNQDDVIPSAPSPTSDPDLVMSLFSDIYPDFTKVVFNSAEDQSTVVTLEVFEGNNTLKFDSFDFQSIDLDPSLNVESRNTFHIDYYTRDGNALQLTFIADNGTESVYDFTIATDEWQRVEIPFSALSETLDLTSLTSFYITGNGTFYFDNIYFSGDTPVESGPLGSAPVDPAPIPIRVAENVISIFSDAYDDLPNTNFNPFWQQATQVSIVEIQENSTLKYENLNYQGTQFESSIDVTVMDFFHINYWTKSTTPLELYLISPGPTETEFIIEVEQDGWQSVDIPLSEYAPFVDLTEVIQLKIEGVGTVFFDNLYFFEGDGNPVVTGPTAAPEPVHDASNVVSLFSNSYDNVTVDTWSAPWDDADVADISIYGNDVKHYTNLEFAGIEFISETIDGTNLTHLHFDIWTPDPTVSPNNLNVRLVDFGSNGVWSGGDDVEHDLTFTDSTTPKLKTGEWISFDIPIDDFESMITREHMAQLLFISINNIDEFYLDNLYFYESVSVSNEEINELPKELKLEQNYPNPFNPSTSIEFSLPESANVSLIIYNSLGQRVANLVDSRLSAGLHSLTWDASNAASGMYIYQLISDNSVITKKMILIK